MLEKNLTQYTPNEALPVYKPYALNSLTKKSIACGLLTVGYSVLGAEQVEAMRQIPVSSQELYGFGSGLRDGFLFSINCFWSLFSDTSWAADGNGIRSSPNTGLGYYVGMFLTGGSQSVFWSQFTSDDD